MPLGRRFEGLARGADGTFYGAKGNQLWTIDLNAHTVTQVGSSAYGDVSALEFAFGNTQPGVDVPGIPPSWTDNGILFGFSNDIDSMVIINAATGVALPYMGPAGVDRLDGIILLTETTGPYRPVVASVGD